ncbi:glycosyltransferase [Leptolyngbya sp. FACHB-711]|uniref:glycosyltransferase family 2 protein n=1 Tax=unclassified Leptolyngbya TaxID=2650499 RepID=UPI001686E3CE|nr:glycosyltransferase [Leptolyngbya sp. FACHB-711]MBD1853047.1 glycosyltransferase [Cyanobacteria bacterium FACHB-502]MBD2026109.1 glycosyltransferase [Leptolyngbya sp. FACHB-711]
MINPPSISPPLISIVIPAYNAEATIQRTIQSVLIQTYTYFELLIVDDESKDATLEIAKRFSDPRIKVFSCEHAGSSATRNRGIEQASGDYIALLDADDVWTPKKLELQLHALQTHPEAAVAYSWTDYIDEADRFYRKGCHAKHSGNVYAKLLLMNFIENGSNTLICKRAFSEIGNFDASLSNSQDWDMWLRLAAHYSFVCVPQVQVLYRISPGSASTNVKGIERNCMRILDRCFTEATESIQSLKNQSFSNLYFYLGLRAAEVSRSRRSNLIALRYLFQAFRYEPSMLWRRQALIKIALTKIVFNMVLSPSVARSILIHSKERRLKRDSSLSENPALQ